MKKLMILGVALVLMSMTKGDGVMTKEKGVYVPNIRVILNIKTLRKKEKS